MSERRRFPAPAPRAGETAPAPRAAEDSSPKARPAGPKSSGPFRGSKAPRPHAPQRDAQDRQAAGGQDPEQSRKQTDENLQPGLKPVLELLEQSPDKIDTVFVRKGRKDSDTDAILDRCRAQGVRFSLVDDAFLARLYSGRHQGVIARLFAAGFHELPDLLEEACDAPLPLLLALDQVQDPGNAGTLARTLYAMGGGGLIVPRHNGVYLGAAAARVSAGALEKLPVAKVANLGQALDEAENAGFTIYGAWSGADPNAASPAASRIVDAFTFTPRLPAVLVLGGEDAGLRPHIAKRCESLVRIPLAREFDSLNVAQAGAIIIGAFAARSDRKGRSGR